METLNNLFLWINKYLWGPPMIIILMGTHLFLTFRTGFIQRKIFTAIKLSVKKDKGSQGDISQFAALTTALASTIGTGNIIGVGTAIALGGPGAVLWCWLTGVFGIATKYSESLISVKYRVKTEDGTMLGGAMYALERGLKLKWLGVIFAILTALAAFGIGCTVQANAITSVVKTNLGISPWIVGIVLAVITAIVIIGGVQSISRVCEKFVPFMAIFYVLGCIVILGFNFDYLGDAIVLICKSAFTARAAGGGFAGSTIMIAARYGIARGLFSNESGMGSAPILAAAAQTKNPVRQALVSSTGTFWDTVVVCLMTGLVLVSSILKYPHIDTYKLGGGELTSAAFAQIPFHIGTVILVIGLLTFAYSTILGWSYYGERCAEYLFGKKILFPYKLVYVILVFVGSVSTISLVWNLADTLNALMAIPNIIAVLLLSNVIVKETKYYLNGRLDEVDSTPIPTVRKKI
jgi:AGCS family alanine or glycine:cation symporter